MTVLTYSIVFEILNNRGYDMPKAELRRSMEGMPAKGFTCTLTHLPG